MLSLREVRQKMLYKYIRFQDEASTYVEIKSSCRMIKTWASVSGLSEGFIRQVASGSSPTWVE